MLLKFRDTWQTTIPPGSLLLRRLPGGGGGFWERLIQSVKRSLKKVLGQTTLNFDQPNTLLVEVERVINSRPLTYVEDDTSGTSYVLSPSHLIYGRKITSASNGSHFEVISTNDTLTRRARQQKHLVSLQDNGERSI